MISDDSAFYVDLKDDRFFIRILKDPTNENDMYDFFNRHERKLHEIQGIKSTRLFFDVYELSFNLTTMSYIPTIVAHFRKTQTLSNLKLKACSVYVYNAAIAAIIQPILDKYPGEVPTLISSDKELCKKFLRDAK